MGISVVDQFNYQGQKFNFERDAFDTLAEMKAFPETSVPPKGFECYCAETDKKYKFDVNNSVDSTTGKWREVESGGSGTGYKTITWDNSSNMNNYKTEGIYLIKGIHSNSGDNLPITAYANGDIGGVLTVSVSTEDSTTKEQIISQSLILGNRVGAETKQYIRSCIVKDSTETWTAWKEANTILYFGEKASGQATRADIDAAIDNGQYAGVYVDTDGFLPQGATFTLTVINNYAATASSSLPANYRQVTQIFIYTPISTDGSVNKSVICKRDGIGGDTISWSTLVSMDSSNNLYTINNLSSLKPDSDVNTIKSVLGSYASFKDAYDKNYTFLNITDTEKCLVNVSVGNGVVEFTYISIEFNDNNTNLMIYKKVTFSNNEWVACTDTDSYFFGKFIEEAPEDSKTYGRKNGEWVTIQEGGGTGTVDTELRTGSNNPIANNAVAVKFNEVDKRTSQVYANYDAITSSGETDTNKIYIDGETVTSYIYKDGEFVSVGGDIPYYNKAYIEFETPFVYGNGTRVQSLTVENDVIYMGFYGGGVAAYNITLSKILWKTSAFNAGIGQKSIVVKGDYVYYIGTANKDIIKIDKYTGNIILRISHSEISYGGMWIFNINNTLYMWGLVDKTLYIINEEDLSITPSGFYDGNIEAIDFCDLYGIVYTSDNKIIWLGLDFSEKNIVDATDVTNISNASKKYIRCVYEVKMKYCIVATDNYSAIVTNTGINFSNQYMFKLLKEGTIECAGPTKYENGGAVCGIHKEGIIKGNNGLFYSDAISFYTPFSYDCAININGNVYFTYSAKTKVKIIKI